MTMLESVADHISRKYGISVRPGFKFDCVFCSHHTMSLKKDGTLAKCFHPSCMKSITTAQTRSAYRTSAAEVLDIVRSDFHSALVNPGDAASRSAFSFLCDERQLHEGTIRQSDLGVVPVGYDLDAAFSATLSRLDSERKQLTEEVDKQLASGGGVKQSTKKPRARRQTATRESGNNNQDPTELLSSISDGIDRLVTIRDEFAKRLKHVQGWIAFFFTDASHRVTSIRFRKPYTKSFQSYKPSATDPPGVFGLALFHPLLPETAHDANTLVIVEGEFNQLQLHSLIRRVQDSAVGCPVDYAPNIVATGSASNSSVSTIQSLLRLPGTSPIPLVIHDNDDAGEKMTSNLNCHFCVDATTPPMPGTDIDDFVRSFGTQYDVAFARVRELIEHRKRLPRPFPSLHREVFRTRQKQGHWDQRRPFEINSAVAEIVVRDLRNRGCFYFDDHEAYFFWTDESLLVPLCTETRDRMLLLAKYGLNVTEQTLRYIVAHLVVEAFQNGQRTTVRRFSHYEAQTNTLYLSNLGSKIYRITHDRIVLVDNGQDGVLFLPNDRDEPFELCLDGPDTEDLFATHLTKRINFQKNLILSSDDLRALFTNWFFSLFFGALLPTRPILAFLGVKGSGKSMTLRRVGLLLFGKHFEVKQLPDKEDAFDAVVTSSHFAAFDNADSKVAWLPDRLAVCATGGSVPKRILYTTNKLADFPITAFLGITSRTPYFRRDDVADRLLTMNVDRIPPGEVVAERDLLDVVLSNRDRILTCVVRQLQGVLSALGNTSGLAYTTSLRMADYGAFALRLGDANGAKDKVEGLLARLAKSQSTFACEGDPVVEVLLSWVASNPASAEARTAGELHKELSQHAHAINVGFPVKSGQSLAGRLRGLRDNLRHYSIEVEIESSGHQNRYRFWPSHGPDRDDRAASCSGGLGDSCDQGPARVPHSQTPVDSRTTAP